MSGNEFELKIARHMGSVDEKLGSITTAIIDIKNEQKNATVRNGSVISELQSHVDKKITECNDEIIEKLNIRPDRADVRAEITIAIKASERRTYYKLAFIGSIIVFMYEYAEPIINFINMLRGK